MISGGEVKKDLLPASMTLDLCRSLLTEKLARDRECVIMPPERTLCPLTFPSTLQL